VNNGTGGGGEEFEEASRESAPRRDLEVTAPSSSLEAGKRLNSSSSSSSPRPIWLRVPSNSPSSPPVRPAFVDWTNLPSEVSCYAS